MAKLEWDKAGEHWFEAGVSKGVLYPLTIDETTGVASYATGVAWNGLTGVTEAPSGADSSDLWADNIKYASLRAAETFGGTIEAYTFPDEFAECDGSIGIAGTAGVQFGQQKRKSFGLCYRTEQGNDVDANVDDGYKLHLVYNCTVSPSQRQYQTMNESPDAITFSWDYTSNPVAFTHNAAVTAKLKPVSCIIIDSKKLAASQEGKAKLETLEARLYGGDNSAPTFPTPDDVYVLMSTGSFPT